MDEKGIQARPRFLAFCFYLIMWLVIVIGISACSPVADPGMGKAFLEAINIEDFDTADTYVCPTQQGQIGPEILKKAQVPPKGMEVLGLTSPGMAEISCSSEDAEAISCSFWSPQLQCTGNILAGEEVTCTSWKTQGTLYTLVFTLEEGKICGYDFTE